MAGTPKKRAVLKQIQEDGGFGPIFERIGNGEGIGKIALDYGCSRQTLAGILGSKKLDPELQGAYKLAAQAHVERATEIVDAVDAEGPNGHANIAKARLQADHRKWLAEKLDRAFFGEQPKDVRVALSMDEAWLNAIKSVQRTKIEARQIPSGDIVDAELIEDKADG